MTIPKNMSHYGAVIRAWRAARWANHAWGLIPPEGLAEVWNVRPSLAGFVGTLPGYAIAKGWVHEGAAGYGILGPDLGGQTYDEYHLRVDVGSHSQLRVDCHPDWTRVRYLHNTHEAEATAEYADGQVLVISCDGWNARPRDWARLARVLCVAYDVYDARAEWIAENLRNMMPTKQWAEFETYFDIRDPAILVGPEAILAAI